MFTEQDLKQIAAHGLTVEAVERQIENFRRGFPSLQVVNAASPADGIVVLTAEQAAAYAGVSRSHLFRLFRQAYGVSPQEYLCRLRLQHAAQLLADGSPVAQAAYSAGFADLPNFSRRFRLEYGTAPSLYAKKEKE